MSTGRETLVDNGVVVSLCDDPIALAGDGVVPSGSTWRAAILSMAFSGSADGALAMLQLSFQLTTSTSLWKATRQPRPDHSLTQRTSVNHDFTVTPSVNDGAFPILGRV